MMKLTTRLDAEGLLGGDFSDQQDRGFDFPNQASPVAGGNVATKHAKIRATLWEKGPGRAFEYWLTENTTETLDRARQRRGHP